MGPRVLVVGAGGLGGVIAGRLRRDGLDVASLVRPGPIADALAADGLVVHDGPVRFRVPARPLVDLSGEAPFDVVVLATQPTEVEAAARAVADRLAPGGVVLVLQNGLCEARVADVLGPDRVVGVVVSFGASVDAPGVVRRTTKGGFTVGRWGAPADAAVARVVDVLGRVAPARPTDDLPGARWSKLAFNASISTLGTLGGDRVGPLVAHRFVRRLALEIMSETALVARAEGVRPKRLAGLVDLGWLTLDPSAPEGLGYVAKDVVVRALGHQLRDMRSSMLRAIEQGKPPAVDFLNGEVASRGARRGVPTPVNEAARRAVHDVAAGALPASLDTLRALFDQTRGQRP